MRARGTNSARMRAHLIVPNLVVLGSVFAPSPCLSLTTVGCVVPFCSSRAIHRSWRLSPSSVWQEGVVAKEDYYSPEDGWDLEGLQSDLALYAAVEVL